MGQDEVIATRYKHPLFKQRPGIPMECFGDGGLPTHVVTAFANWQRYADALEARIKELEKQS